MQNPPDSAATPTIPSGHDVGAVVAMVVRVLSSRRGDAPLPILSSVIFIEACVEPMGVVTVMPMSPGAAFGATRIGISTSVGFPANGLVSMPGRLNLTVAPTRFFHGA